MSKNTYLNSLSLSLSQNWQKLVKEYIPQHSLFLSLFLSHRTDKNLSKSTYLNSNVTCSCWASSSCRLTFICNNDQTFRHSPHDYLWFPKGTQQNLIFILNCCANLQKDWWDIEKSFHVMPSPWENVFSILLHYHLYLLFNTLTNINIITTQSLPTPRIVRGTKWILSLEDNMSVAALMSKCGLNKNRRQEHGYIYNVSSFPSKYVHHILSTSLLQYSADIHHHLHHHHCYYNTLLIYMLIFIIIIIIITIIIKQDVPASYRLKWHFLQFDPALLYWQKSSSSSPSPSSPSYSATHVS